MRQIATFKNLWRTYLTLIVVITVIPCLFETMCPFALKRQTANVVLALLDSPIYEVRLEACKRAGGVCWSLVNPLVPVDQARSEIERKILSRLMYFLNHADNKEVKLQALYGFTSMCWWHSEKAYKLAEESLFSDDRDLVVASLGLIQPTTSNREKVSKRMIEVAQYPECQLPVLERLSNFYLTKGFPWGSTPSPEEMELLKKLSWSWNPLVSVKAYECIAWFSRAR